MAAKNIFSVTEKVDIYLALCDGFTLSGAIMILVGIMGLIGGMGAFDGVTYALGFLVRFLLPFLRKEHETFYDYKQRKKEKHRSGNATFLFVVGGVFFAVGIIFMCLFYSVY